MTTPLAHGWMRDACIVSLLLLPLTAALPGCQAMNSSRHEPFNPQQSAAAATRQLQALVPVGTGLVEATSTLQRNGFSCHALAAPSAGFRSSHLCTFTPPTQATNPGPTAPPAPIQWIVTVDSADGTTVEALRLQREPKDL